MLNYFPGNFRAKSILAYFATLASVGLIFFNYQLHVLWIVFGLIEVVLFFQAFTYFSDHWKSIKEHLFISNIFWYSLIIRSIYVFFSYYFYIYQTGSPYEFEFGDSYGYHDEAVYIVDLFNSNDLGYYFNRYKFELSDMGINFWYAIIYYFSYNSILLARIFNALVSTISVLLIYKISKRNFSIQASRLSAVIATFFPIFIFYSGLHLKETVMTFFLVAFIERADFLIRSPHFRMWNIITVVLIGFSLFFFRTVLAVSAWVSFILALLYSRSKYVSHGNRFVYVIVFVLMSGMLLSNRILFEINQYTTSSSANQKSQMENFSNREGGNQLAKYGSAMIFAPMMIIAPFPTMVHIKIQQNLMMMNGNLFAKNILSFFFIFALISLIKQKKLKDNILILSMLFSYLAVLSLSGFALSERFHFPTLPFIIILSGYGLTQMKPRTVKYFDYYLMGMILVIIAWNWFKLAGRGIA